MKKAAISLIAAAALSSAPAQAQVPPMPTPDAATRQAMDQTRARMESVTRTERAQILGALTAAHRALLANIAGQLATSITPDYDAAAKQLDSTLTGSEAQSIISAERSAQAQARSIVENMRKQIPAPPGSGRFHERGVVSFQEPGAGREPDAGRILLRVAMSGPVGMMMNFHVTGGAPPKP